MIYMFFLAGITVGAFGAMIGVIIWLERKVSEQEEGDGSL